MEALINSHTVATVWELISASIEVSLHYSGHQFEADGFQAAGVLQQHSVSCILANHFIHFKKTIMGKNNSRMIIKDDMGVDSRFLDTC